MARETIARLSIGWFLVAWAVLMSRNGDACFNTTPTAEAIANYLQFRPTTTVAAGATTVSTASTTTAADTTTLSTNYQGCYDPTTLENRWGAVNPFKCLSVISPCTSYGANYIRYPTSTVFPDGVNCENNNVPASFVRCNTTSNVICRPQEVGCLTSETTGNSYANTNACLRGVDISAPAYCNCDSTNCTQIVQDDVCCVLPLVQTNGQFFISATCT